MSPACPQVLVEVGFQQFINSVLFSFYLQWHFKCYSKWEYPLWCKCFMSFCMQFCGRSCIHGVSQLTVHCISSSHLVLYGFKAAAMSAVL